MNHQMGPVGLRRLSLLPGLLFDQGRTDHEIAQGMAGHTLRNFAGKAQNIGCPRALSISFVKFPTLRLINEANRQLCIGIFAGNN